MKFRPLRLRKHGDDGTILPVTNDTTTATGTTAETNKTEKGFSQYLWGRHPLSYGSTMPTFKQWLVATYPDLISLAIFGALDWGVFEAPPPLKRNFPIVFKGTGDVVYPTFAYPVREQFVPSWAASLAACGVPILVIIVFNVIRIRSFWDVNNGILGVLYSLVLATLFQVTVKTIVGGLRPHWLSMCQPDVSLAAARNESGLNGVGWNGIMYTSEICTNPDSGAIKNSLESFPSGHTTASFAGFVFLFLYLNAKLKVWSNHHPSMWKLGIVYAPILAATLIGGSLTVDQSHNWYDVLAGATIGTVFAFSSYRTVYASIWDWRWNHIPLHRGNPFAYSAEQDTELMDAVVTRKAGWGHMRRLAALGRRSEEQCASMEVGRGGTAGAYNVDMGAMMHECQQGVTGDGKGLRLHHEAGSPSNSATSQGDEMV